MSGWEFRKHAPSEQAAVVPASSDPFASPKWAPAIWRMPEGVVLVVNLIRAIATVVVFCVRHPVSTATVAGLGWLGWRYGWPVPAFLVGLALTGLTAWALADRPSFVRLVARPARARWRRVMVYQRHWQPVMVMSGLAYYRNGREYLPVVRKVQVTPTTDRILVKMLSGQAPSSYESHADNLAHGFKTRLCRVRTAQPGHLWLEFVRKDALAKPIPALPIPSSAEAVDLERLPIGRCEDGTPWLLRLLGTHVLLAGATGAGKASLLWSLIRALLPAVRAGLVEVWALDPKRMELAFGKALFRRYSDDPLGGMVALLEEAVEEMQLRAKWFAGRTRTFLPSLEFPFLVVLVDELAFVTAYCPDRDLRKRAEAALATLTSQGRSVGVCVVGALQDPRKEVVNIRNLFPTRIALRLDESDMVDMVLADGARDRGALADLISPVPDLGAGVAFVRLEASPDPVRVRATFVSDADIHAMVTEYGHGALKAVGAGHDGQEAA